MTVLFAICFKPANDQQPEPLRLVACYFMAREEAHYFTTLEEAEERRVTAQRSTKFRLRMVTVPYSAKQVRGGLLYPPNHPPCTHCRSIWHMVQYCIADRKSMHGVVVRASTD